MMKLRLFALLCAATFVGLIFYAPSAAQVPGGGGGGSGEETCPAIVSDALVALENDCTGIGRNAACYGNNNVLASFNREFEPEFFTSPGEQADLIDLDNLETGPLDIENRLWGIALMNVQANIPGTLPGQNVLMMLLGDTYVENDVPTEDAFISETTVQVTTSRQVPLTENPDGTAALTTIPSGAQVAADAVHENGAVRVSFGEQFGWIAADAVAMPRTLAVLPTINDQTRTPMQAFYFSTGLGNSTCVETPDSLIVQGPEELVVDIRANGADISIGSTIALVSYETLDPPQMELFVLEDEATITCEDGTEVIIEEGFSTRGTLTDLIDLGVNNFVDNRLVNCDWTEPEPVPAARLLEIAGPVFNVSDDVLNYELELPLIEQIAQAPTSTPLPPPVFIPSGATVTPLPSATPIIAASPTPLPPPPADDDDDDDDDDRPIITGDVGIGVLTSTTLTNEGETIFLDVNVVNNDTTAPATGVSVTTNLNSLPFTLSGASAADGTFDAATGIWTIGDIPAGGATGLFINVIVDAGTAGNTYTFSGTVTTTSGDNNASNNTGSVAITVTNDPLADPLLTLGSEDPNFVEGDTRTIDVDVTNADPVTAAENVSVALNVTSLPFTFISADQGTYNSGTGVWTIGTLAPGATVNLNLEIQANNGSTGNYTLTGMLTSTNDGVTNNNNATLPLTVSTPADGAITLVANPLTVTEGGGFAFTYTVTNTGSTLQNASVSTTLPSFDPFLVYASDAASQGTYDNVVGSWAIGDIAVGATATLTVNVTTIVGSSIASPYMIDATLGANNESNFANNTASVTVTVTEPPAEVEVTDAAFAPDPVNEGTASDFTVVISNTSGSVTATGITVTIGGILAFTENGSTAEPGTGYSAGTWSIPAIAPGGTATLVLDVTGPVGINTLSATITAADNDDNTGNNFGSDTLTVNKLVDLAVTLNIAFDGVDAPGAPVTATITVTNNGPSDADNVFIMDDLAVDDGVAPIMLVDIGNILAPPQGTYDFATGTWDVGTVIAGDTVIFDINIQADAAAGAQNFTYTVTVTSSTTDSNAANDTANEAFAIPN